MCDQDAEPLPKECNGVIQLDGRPETLLRASSGLRYKTEDAVEYQNDCILRGAPGTAPSLERDGADIYLHFLWGASMKPHTMEH